MTRADKFAQVERFDYGFKDGKTEKLVYREATLVLASNYDAVVAALREAEEYRAERDKRLHGKFGFVPSQDDPTKCGCAYCTRDVEALADHAAEMEMQLFLEGGWKDRAEKAEAELAEARQLLGKTGGA